YNIIFPALSQPHTQTLETLNLGHNAIGNEGVRHLKNGLIGNRSILRLGLASAKLTCEGAVAVAEFVAESPRLLRLDLRENEIKTGGLMALSLALRVNQSLLRMDLDREPKKEAVKSFIETQRALLTEIQNGCRRNFVLAKEKEERLQQSASMAEIAIPASEDSGPAPEDSGPAPEDSGPAPEDSGPAPEDSGPAHDEMKTTPEQPKEGESSPVPDAHPQGEGSDSDTEEEEEENEGGKCESDGSRLLGAPGPVGVASPGRGHKIFLVTRVENPTEEKGGRDIQGGKEEGAGPHGGSDLPNGLQAEFGRTTSCDSSKDSRTVYSDTELEALLRDATQEPEPTRNTVTL
ncbi:hypothetical protein FKM82_024718, partial [Ascaphus truei]